MMPRTLVNGLGILVLGLLGLLAFDSLRPVATTLRPELTYVLLRPDRSAQGSLALVQVRRHFRRGGLLGQLSPLESRPFLKLIRFQPGRGRVLEERFLTSSLELGPGHAVPFVAEDTLWACSAPSEQRRSTLFRWDGAEFQRLPLADQAAAFQRLGIPEAGPKEAALVQQALTAGGTWTVLAGPEFSWEGDAPAPLSATEVAVGGSGWTLVSGPEGTDLVVQLRRPEGTPVELYRIEDQTAAVDSAELGMQLAEPLLVGYPR